MGRYSFIERIGLNAELIFEVDMKSRVLLLFAFLTAAGTAAGQSFFPLAAPECGGIADLALIYYGGVHRPYSYVPQDFQPYVSWTDPDTAREEWLFDGFLFIEFKDGMEHEYAQGYGYAPARRVEWDWYLDRLFASTTGLAALDQCVASTLQRIGPPLRKRKVVITLPEPIYGQTDWGTLDGETPLNFYRVEDRLAACQWYLDELQRRWTAAGFTHLEMVGIYWVAEQRPTGGAQLLPRVSQAIHGHGWKFFWIPYWNASGAGDWKALGFDVAYQQPNYFFSLTVPVSRLTDVQNFAKSKGMGMEMEWDSRVIDSPDPYLLKMDDYMNAFESSGFLASGAQAHYEGGGAMIRLSKATQANIRSRYYRYCRILSDRQAIADSIRFRQGNLWLLY
jgi:hypothetical protein